MTIATILKHAHDHQEEWKYTDLRKLLSDLPAATAANVNTTLHGDEPSACLIFKNGAFQSKQSRFGTLPSCILMGDPDTGYKLTLGEHTCLVTQPLELRFLVDDQAPPEIAIKLSIEIGENGRLTLLERYRNCSSILTVETDIVLHSRAKFVHGKIISESSQIGRTRAELASGASYTNFTLICKSPLVRNEIDIWMNGEEAQAALSGAMLLKHQEHVDTTLRIHHKAPHCSSRQVYKTVLADKSRGVFQGKIFVDSKAQKTDGYQLSRALLLSDQAEMDVKPELEIYADDVKCSHGSAIGDLDENALFYLQTRGLSETAARDMLIGAFIGEIFDTLQVEEWRPLFHAASDGWSQ